jgi:pyridoxamine 5'-phosphate oxidase
MAKRDIAAIREEYQRHQLRRGDLAADPLAQFKLWLDQAFEAALPEPTAMTLATAGDDGQPDARTVLLKGAEADGLRFFTNYGSAKGRQLAENPRAALLFFWPQLQRQVRVAGRVEKTTRAESEAYFASRPLSSRLGALASPQSDALASRAELESEWAALAEKYGENVPCPENWGGYRVLPETWEFWQGRPSRLHDRFRYRRPAGGGEWIVERLAP